MERRGERKDGKGATRASGKRRTRKSREEYRSIKAMRIALVDACLDPGYLIQFVHT